MAMRLLIILSKSIFLKVMKDKYSFEFRGHSDEILLLFFKSTHCLEKWELKISFFFFYLKIFNKFIFMRN